MPARFRRIIHQQTQVSSFETFSCNPESLTIVLLSKSIELQSSSPWYSPNCCWKMLSLSDLVTAGLPLAQIRSLHTSSFIALYRKVRRPCFEVLWGLNQCAKCKQVRIQRKKYPDFAVFGSIAMNDLIFSQNVITCQAVFRGSVGSKPIFAPKKPAIVFSHGLRL